ncbi:TauD/TfdA family dioxygenase [Novosphingobium sp. 2580]|uniref:TauD/TfdA family dioxygenase n=2 Tax=Novosphingobium album (ex Hu et al. 2023) TaxID=2930093 RepID=A0ABT0AZ07_9SPHN|nr:TauD/TfdA family dioxygenase [Novosphingobium album (ex Hu et al. 2023)]
MPQGAQAGERDIEVLPVTGAIGAEVRGVRLSGDLDAETVARIRAILLEHKVIFFRDQHHLDDAAQEAFSALFGDLQKHPMARAAGQSEALLDLGASEAFAASIWHTDMTFLPDPAAFAVLRAMELPPVGGDTMWANAANAYRRLPEPLKPLAESLWAIHSTDFDFDGTFTATYKARMRDYGAGGRQHVVRTEHPVVQVHPETGERSLILGSWVKRFVGLNNSDSAKIFEVLQSYVTEPENTVRWTWRPGDVAMWDNRATQHRSVPDHGNAPRQLRRSTVLGTVATAIDGQKSRRLDT